MTNQYTTGRAKPTPLPTRFWAKVKKGDSCWLWTGAKRSFGYGVFMVKKSEGKSVLEGAHRVSYRLHYGDIPSGLQVLHHCDVPDCVRPDHLFLGTQQDNIDDMRAKRRHAQGVALNHAPQNGERNHNAKLTDADVEYIRYSSERPTVLARQFGVTYSTIWSVRRRKHRK